MTPDLTRFADDAAAAGTLALLGNSLWRKARDAAKELCKRDRARYLDLLIAANLGLAREMAAKGMIKEALTVADYLATVAPPECVATLRAEIANLARPAHQPAIAATDRPAACWETALKVDETLDQAGGTPPGDAELAAIDLLVADPFVPAVAADDARAARLAAELAAVRAAIAATGDGRWDDAREALRGVPRRSVFGHWRMFLRGARCVFEDDFATARQCFASLPPAGAPARAARVLAPELIPAAASAPTKAKVAFFLAATGQPAAWVAPLMDAIAAWNPAAPAKAFLALLRGMKGQFPSSGTDLPARLTDLILPFRRDTSAETCHRTDRIMDRLVSLPGMGAVQRSHLLIASTRALCVLEGRFMDPALLRKDWETVTGLMREVHGPNPLRDSLASQWLGETILQGIEDDSLPYAGIGCQSALRLARNALELAAKQDSSNVQAGIALLRAHEMADDKKARNQLLDDLAKRFPDNKTILAEAGSRALERKAFDKALGFLTKALALDPLDKSLKARVAQALLNKIVLGGNKRRSSGALWDELLRIAEDRPGPEYQIITRWMLLLRRSLVDPDAAAARNAAAEAARLAPSLPEFTLFEHILALVYQDKDREHDRAHWNNVLAQGPLTWTVLIALTDQICFFSLDAGWSETMNRSVHARIDQMLRTLMRDCLDRWPEGPLEYLDYSAARKRGTISRYGGSLLGDCEKTLHSELGKRLAMTRHGADPSLCLARLVSEIERGDLECDSGQLVKRLDSIIADATELQRPATLAKARMFRDAALKRLERAKTPPLTAQPDFPFGDDDGDEDDGFDVDDIWDDGDDEDIDAPWDQGVVPPEFAAAFERALAGGNPAMIQAVRDVLLSSGLPASIIDRLLAEVTGSRPPPKPTRKPRRRR